MKSGILSLFSAVLLLSMTPGLQAQPSGADKPALYNHAKQKLLEGKTLFSHTISRFDVDTYCEAAKHYDFTFFDMQHSTLTWADIEKMIGACPLQAATPMIRVADELESTLQHATDIGALGIIMPTVDTVEKAQTTVKYAKYPPEGRRSNGQNQASRIYPNYKKTANDNMLIVVMIETPIGVASAYDIARVPGVDVVFAANNDLNNFSGFEQGSKEYDELVTKIKEATLKAGKVFGVTAAPYGLARPDKKDIRFYQNGDSFDGWKPPAAAGRGGRGNAKQ